MNKKVLNTAGIIAAVLLSFILVAALIFMPFIYGGFSFLKTDHLYDVMTDLDYTELISGEIGWDNENLPDINGEIVNELLETEMAEEMIEVYVENLFHFLEGKEEKNLTAREVEKIADKHLDELADVLKDYLGADFFLTEETYREMAKLLVKELSGTIEEMIPSYKELGFDDNVIRMITNFRKGTYFYMSLAVAVVLSILIFLCRMRRGKGCIYLGVDYCLSAVFTFILSCFVKSLDINMIFKGNTVMEVLFPYISGYLNRILLIWGGIISVIGIIFIVVFFIKHKRACALSGK